MYHSSNREGHTPDKTFGKISLVDLAGSENLKYEENKTRVSEGIAVNQSLTALKTVIHRLIESKDSRSAIPYRDNPLTMLLKDSIGGTAKTLVIVSINSFTSHLCFISVT